MSSLSKQILGDTTPDPESIIAGVRMLVPGQDSLPLDQAVTKLIADKDAQIADLTAQLAAKPAEMPPTTPPVTPPVTPDGPFKLVVEETFDAGKLDSKTWWPAYDKSPGTGGVGTRKGSLCTFRDGNLIIAAERPSNTSTDYTKWFSTGAAMGPRSQTYGRWEVTQKASKGAGFWPNLQLWPTAGKQPSKYGKADGWPETIEVDIAESPEADRSKVHTTIHYGTDNTQKGKTITIDATQFHVWAVEWTPEALVFFVDGKEYHRVTDKAQIPTTPHHLVIQSDMGSWAGKPTSSDPLRMEIEVSSVKQFSYSPT